jgi:Ni,Fe-hydrogenase III large subunit
VAEEILKTLDYLEKSFGEICSRIYSLPSLLARFEDIGRVTKQQAFDIGTVGMAARSCGLNRDIRVSHPFQYFKTCSVNPCLIESGDVLARGRLRVLEVMESIRLIRELVVVIGKTGGNNMQPEYNYRLIPGRTGLSLVEGWRGEICHSAVTDQNGRIVRYKVKDPSFHNWLALALAVRNQEISDFPVCNKSFNLSYCGNDL